jgi:hypothetical protein
MLNICNRFILHVCITMLMECVLFGQEFRYLDMAMQSKYWTRDIISEFESPIFWSGWPDEFAKDRPKCSPAQLFLSELIHNFYFGTNGPDMRAIFANFRKLSQVCKQSPSSRKIPLLLLKMNHVQFRQGN